MSTDLVLRLALAQRRWLTSDMGNDARRVQRVGQLCSTAMTYDELKAAIRAGTITPVRHGAVVQGPPASDGRQRQVELIAGTVPVIQGPDWALSHTSAVALLGLPMSRGELDRVWITRPPQGHQGHHRPGLVTRVCGLEPDEITRVGPYRVTNLARTTVDMARQFGFATGVLVADAAAARGCTREAMQKVVDRSARRPGNGIARRVVAFADGRSESGGESLMRAMCELQGCAPTDIQIEIYSPEGHFIARCDFGWLEYGIVGEHDGVQKYGRLVRPGQSVSDVVAAEKDREAQIRDQGLEIIRFCKVDLRRPAAAAARLRRLMDQRGRRETPWTSPIPAAPPDENSPWDDPFLGSPW